MPSCFIIATHGLMAIICSLFDPFRLACMTFHAGLAIIDCPVWPITQNLRICELQLLVLWGHCSWALQLQLGDSPQHGQRPQCLGTQSCWTYCHVFPCMRGSCNPCVLALQPLASATSAQFYGTIEVGR